MARALMDAGNLFNLYDAIEQDRNLKKEKEKIEENLGFTKG
ncbi:hypothetical protein [Lachnobacterium bovis]|nr:hypothetical protein [Lachnobacterium bovis]